MTQKPDFEKIFTEIAQKNKRPQTITKQIANIENWNSLNIIEINEQLFNDNLNEQNQDHKAYDKHSVKKILNYQKQEQLNNTQLANHFKISRSTVINWRKKYLTEKI